MEKDYLRVRKAKNKKTECTMKFLKRYLLNLIPLLVISFLISFLTHGQFKWWITIAIATGYSLIDYILNNKKE